MADARRQTRGSVTTTSASAGDIEALGWGVSVSRSVEGIGMRASIDYTQSNAQSTR